MSQNPEPFNSAPELAVTSCANCQSPMPVGLRFCRNCGFRLGEGVAEYTETARFPPGHPAHIPSTEGPLTTTYGLGAMASGAAGVPARRRKRLSGMSWMFLGLLAFFLVAAIFTAIVAPIRRGANIQFASAPAPRSYFGIDGFESTDEGVTFHNVEPPGGPADKAGLVGGDIITTFDGKTITEQDQIGEILKTTPIGKTVDVTYVRDGESRTTKLTTVAQEEINRLNREFRNRPQGRGRFGYDDDRTERVEIPGTKLHGVRLEDGAISQSLPADMAGIKDGDIIIEFDGIPIRTPQELSSRVNRALPYSTVKVVLMRGIEKLEIPVKMGKQ